MSDAGETSRNKNQSEDSSDSEEEFGKYGNHSVL